MEEMNDAEKLNLLADWFDEEAKTGRWGFLSPTNVQNDLREMSRKILNLGGYIPDK
jgi:hypothetical protein